MNLATLGKNEKQREGVWIQFAPAVDGQPAVLFKIAAARNNAFAEKAKVLKKPYKQRDGTFKVPESKQLPLFWQSLAGTVVQGWKGIMSQDESGAVVEVEFSEENFCAFVMLDDIEVRAACDFIITESENEANFLKGETAALIAATKGD